MTLGWGHHVQHVYKRSKFLLGLRLGLVGKTGGHTGLGLASLHSACKRVNISLFCVVLAGMVPMLRYE